MESASEIIESTPDRGGLASRVPFCEWAAEQNVDHCITWPFALTPAGYGRVRHNGVRTSAHRVVLELAKGKPPTPDHVAAHAPIICHNPSCVNPRHLRWATTSENMCDRALDGTVSKQSAHGHIGVSKTGSGKFRAYVYRLVNDERKQVHLGTFETEKEAASAVKSANQESSQ